MVIARGLLADAVPIDAAILAQQLAHASRSGVAPEEREALMVQVDALFAAHQDVVYATCLRYLRDPERAVEVSQDALLKAYRKLPSFRGEARFGTWLVAIARYECLNALRKGEDALTADGVIEATDPERSALGRMRTREREELLRDAAAAVLDPVEQEAVTLRYTELLPLDEIERLLGLDTASGARGLLQRCTRKLRAELRRRLEAMGHGSSFVHGSVE